jgi:hypothetical protein
MERVLAAAAREGVRVVAPRPGGMVEPAVAAPVERWWPALPWRTADEAPVWSTGVRRPGRAAAARVDRGAGVASPP